MTQYSILAEDGQAVVTVVVPGDSKSPYMASEDHPNFKAIIAALVAKQFDDVPALFDVADTIASKFRRLSERVTVEGETVLFDGVAVDSSLTNHILAVLDEGADESSWEALVNFFEKVQTNPDERSREQLYDWIRAQNGLTIDWDGNIVGYKGVQPDETYGYKSISSGSEPVRVEFYGEDSQVFTGLIPNPIGATVEMSRDQVKNDPSVACHVGLHVGTWNYASGFAQGAVLEVSVNPRDVVSVPHCSGHQKVRVCRYTVVDEVEEKYDEAVKGVTPAEDFDLDLTLEPLRAVDEEPLSAWVDLDYDEEEDYDELVEEPPFKVGDRVVNVREAGYASDETTGTVIERDSGLRVEFDDDQGSVSLRPDGRSGGGLFQFEKVESVEEPTKHKFAVGDQVEGGYLSGEATVKALLSNSYLVGFEDGSEGEFALDLENYGHPWHGEDFRKVENSSASATAYRDQAGRFAQGRPGSKRDSTGRFAA